MPIFPVDNNMKLCTCAPDMTVFLCNIIPTAAQLGYNYAFVGA